jgi:glutamate synthase (NADPH/NADH)
LLQSGVARWPLGLTEARVVRRSPMPYRDIEERSKDWGEVLAKLADPEQADLLSTQSARCMNCGTPFCHQTSSGEGFCRTSSQTCILMHAGPLPASA